MKKRHLSVGVILDRKTERGRERGRGVEGGECGEGTQHQGGDEEGSEKKKTTALIEGETGWRKKGRGRWMSGVKQGTAVNIQ